MIEIDHEGYPYEGSLALLKAAKPNAGESVYDFCRRILDEVARAFEATGYGSAIQTTDGEHRVWRFATRGFSGCESIITQMPPLVVAIAWESSSRGGLHVYQVPLFVKELG